MTVMPMRQSMPEDNEQPKSTSDDVAPRPDEDRAVRGRSTIEFPYADLDDGVAVARAIHEKGGAPLARDQLASAMHQPATSGAFSAKINASRMFGFVEFVGGKVKMTELGYDAIDTDETKARAAKAKAFLNVPLFVRAYNEFRNRTLPPRPLGLEQAFVGFGVLPKRGTNARWSFDRSAKQAGFFDNGEDRLVEPIIVGGTPQSARFATEAIPNSQIERSGMTKPPLDAAEQHLVRGLLERMPEPGTSWPLRDRARWLRTLAGNLAMLYGDVDEAEITIEAPKPAPAPAAISQPKHPPKPPEPESPGYQPRARADAAPNWEPAKGGGDLDDDIPF